MFDIFASTLNKGRDTIETWVLALYEGDAYKKQGSDIVLCNNCDGTYAIGPVEGPSLRARADTECRR